MVFRPTAEERSNTATHAVGLLLSLIGAIFILRCVLLHGEVWRWLSGGVYAASLVGVYASSTLSHSASQPIAKHFFRRLDQAFIYLLIVGSYSPFALAYLRSNGWWMLFLGLLWTVALFGFYSKIALAHRVDAVAVWIYLILGWAPVVSAGPILHLAPVLSLYCMAIGGVCYTLGTVFLVNDQRAPYFHAVWHLFVIAGSTFHFYGIWNVIA